jgi:hypothetical protein
MSNLTGRLVLFAIGVVCMTTSMQANAADATNLDPTKSLTIRFQLPASGLIVWNSIDGGGFTFFGGSLGVRFAGIIEAEIGGNTRGTFCNSGTGVTARAGIAPSLLTAPPEGTHWNLRVPVLFSYIHGDDKGSCEDAMNNELHALTGSTGLDATHWSPDSSSGFNIRLLVGIGTGWDHETDPNVTTKWNWAPAGRVVDASLTIGVSFR